MGIRVTLLLSLILCGACSSQMQRSAPLSVQYLSANPLSKDGKTGLPYFLPDTVVPVTVSGDFVVLPERRSDAKDFKPAPADYEYVLTVTVGATKQVPDPNAALMLEYVPEVASDDVFKLAVGANGLLNTVKSTSTDQSGAIVLKLAELAKEALKTASSLGVRSFRVESGTSDDARREECYRRLQKMTIATELNLSDVLRFEGAYAFLTSAVRQTADGWGYFGVPPSERALADEYARYLWSLSTRSEPFSVEAVARSNGMFQSAYGVSDSVSERTRPVKAALACSFAHEKRVR